MESQDGQGGYLDTVLVLLVHDMPQFQKPSACPDRQLYIRIQTAGERLLGFDVEGDGPMAQRVVQGLVDGLSILGEFGDCSDDAFSNVWRGTKADGVVDHFALHLAFRDVSWRETFGFKSSRGAAQMAARVSKLQALEGETDGHVH